MNNIIECKAKSIIVKSKLPDADYVVNPYMGCEFGCLYCYASFMDKYIKNNKLSWGNYAYVKINSIDLFNKELNKFLKRTLFPSIFFSSVTDPYQFVEKKYQLTRGMLNILQENNYLGKISILTKSPLVLRDIDLIKKIKNIEVGLTITTTEKNVGKMLECRSPSNQSRLKALEQLTKNGINTYCFIGPLLPHFAEQKEELASLIKQIAKTGVKSAYVEQLNFNKRIQDNLIKITQSDNNYYYEKFLNKNLLFQKQKIIQEYIINLLEQYNINLKLNKVLTH